MSKFRYFSKIPKKFGSKNPLGTSSSAHRMKYGLFLLIQSTLKEDKGSMTNAKQIITKSKSTQNISSQGTDCLSRSGSTGRLVPIQPSAILHSRHTGPSNLQTVTAQASSNLPPKGFLRQKNHSAEVLKNRSSPRNSAGIGPRQRTFPMKIDLRGRNSAKSLNSTANSDSKTLNRRQMSFEQVAIVFSDFDA